MLQFEHNLIPLPQADLSCDKCQVDRLQDGIHGVNQFSLNVVLGVAESIGCAAEQVLSQVGLTAMNAAELIDSQVASGGQVSSMHTEHCW